MGGSAAGWRTLVTIESPMAVYTDTPKVAMQVSRGLVVASIQIDLDDDVMARFRDDLLARIHATSSRAAILDVSGLETLDAHEFAGLRRVIEMARIMGADSVLVGLRPGVVSALIEADVDVEGLRTATNLDAAYELLEEPEEETEEDSEPEAADEDFDAGPSDRADDLLLPLEQALRDER